MNDGGDWLNWVRLAALGLIWGGAFLFVEIALRGFGPMTVAAARLSIAALVLVPIAVWTQGGLPRGARVWLFAFGAAILSNALPFSLLSWGQTHVTAGVAGVFMAAVPLLVLPLSHVFVPGESMSIRKTLGMVIGFVGVLVLLGKGALMQLGGAGVEVIAQFACLGAACGYAFGSIVTKLAPKVQPISFSAATMLLAALIAAPFAMVYEGWPQVWRMDSTIALVAMGVFPTALAMFLLTKILSTAGPPFLSLVNYQVPLWAIIFGAAFLDEVVPLRLWVALALILVGVALSQNLFRKLFGRHGSEATPPPAQTPHSR